MTELKLSINTFANYVASLKGDEKGEAQVFCDRFFQAFGHAGYKEAGATLESRVKGQGRTTKFADLLWKPHLLMEMKKRGEKLNRHYDQVFQYWLELVPYRPRYVILCNFDEFWIYDFDLQVHTPIDTIHISQLAERSEAFNFMLPEPQEPVFNNNQVEVTRSAADKVAIVFKELIHRGKERSSAQRFILQCIFSMFSEDIGLLPKAFFLNLLEEAHSGSSSYDLIGGLFRQMNNPDRAEGGRYQSVDYFNGGLFAKVQPFELGKTELQLLIEAARENWSRVQPAIFGTLFENSLEKEERHALGAHYTSEADIQKIILPSIVQPWRERLDQTNTLTGLNDLRAEMLKYKVFDPACGSGNFLYVAYREFKKLEYTLLDKIRTHFQARSLASTVSMNQFYGMDIKPFAVELAKVTLLLAKEMVIYERQKEMDSQKTFEIDLDPALPLENLDQNITCQDALFTTWPEADVIIGNPPYQSKNKMQRELGAAYIKRLRAAYPDIPGRADYCVYWFNKAHQQLKPGGRAGLVGTNTIRENYSREGGLDIIVQNGGTITEAVSRQVWSGDASVHVSIVNWVKGEHAGKKRLFTQKGDKLDSPWDVVELERIPASLSPNLDVTEAKIIQANKVSKTCFQGQTHGHEGFLIPAEEAEMLLQTHPEYKAVLKPFLIADELLGMAPVRIKRYVIDFSGHDIFAAQRFTVLFKRLQEKVLPDREQAAAEESRRNQAVLNENPQAKVNKHHANFLKSWWQLSYGRKELMAEIAQLPRYICCARVTMRPIFELISSKISPNDALQVFTFSDDYSFGLLQSGIHWVWFTARCSTLTGRYRYTSESIYDSFPWPQTPTLKQVQAVAQKGIELRHLRNRIMSEQNRSLRDLYRLMELPGKSPLKAAQENLDKAVKEAYGMKQKEDPLAFLLALNQTLTEQEKQGIKPTQPGLPPIVKDCDAFVSDDSVQASHL